MIRGNRFDERPCPNCGLTATADFVDNGVGMQQVGPFGCEACGWIEPTVAEILPLNHEDEDEFDV